MRVGASLCLLVNELVSNSVKHGGRVVRLSLTRQDAQSRDEENAAAPDASPDYYAEINALLAAQAQPGDLGQSVTADPVVDFAGPPAPQSMTAQDMTTEFALNKDAALFTSHVPLTAPLRVVCLQIEDDGPGFAPGFDVRKAANTGLDLVVNISRLDMNGSIVFANHPGGGAQVRITFTLPEN